MARCHRRGCRRWRSRLALVQQLAEVGVVWRNRGVSEDSARDMNPMRRCVGYRLRRATSTRGRRPAERSASITRDTWGSASPLYTNLRGFVREGLRAPNRSRTAPDMCLHVDKIVSEPPIERAHPQRTRSVRDTRDNAHSSNTTCVTTHTQQIDTVIRCMEMGTVPTSDSTATVICATTDSVAIALKLFWLCCSCFVLSPCDRSRLPVGFGPRYVDWHL